MDEFFSRSWPVDRTRIGPESGLSPTVSSGLEVGGGVAGGHPSNILDNPYPVGAVNINGDLPVLLGPDGPTAGGFIVAATVVHAALWKLGQLRPIGDTCASGEVTVDEAAEFRARSSAGG